MCHGSVMCLYEGEMTGVGVDCELSEEFEVIVGMFHGSVICLYEGAMTGVGVDCELSEEFEVIVGMFHGSVLSPFLYAVVVDII